MLLNNNPSKTADCVQYLRSLGTTTTYVYRGCSLQETHPFREAKFRIWAPEEDTSDYYGQFQPVTLAVAPGAVGGPGTLTVPLPPSGVDAGAFYKLVEMRSRGFADNLFTIDKAANNSSVVFCLEWRGWKLLFPGDAELRSWRTMQREGVLEPVHFLKVSHHGSHNGTPDGDIFDAILPAQPPDDRTRRAVVSAFPETYSGIPHEPTNEKLKQRCELVSTLDDPQKPYVDLTFSE